MCRPAKECAPSAGPLPQPPTGRRPRRNRLAIHPSDGFDYGDVVVAEAVESVDEAVQLGVKQSDLAA